LPNTSLAITDKLTEPLLNCSVEGQYNIHAGALVQLFLLVQFVADTPINGCKKRVSFCTRSMW